MDQAVACELLEAGSNEWTALDLDLDYRRQDLRAQAGKVRTDPR